MKDRVQYARLTGLAIALCAASTYAADPAKPQAVAYSPGGTFITEYQDVGGLNIEMKLAAIAGEPIGNEKPTRGNAAQITFHLSDSKTRQPVTGMHPLAWFAARRSEPVANKQSCNDKIRGFMAGQLAARADADLNRYLLLTLNTDKTISIINPHISFSITKLESLVVLPEQGADWALSVDSRWLYVTIPAQSSVVVIDTATRKIAKTIMLGPNTRPVRIRTQPDGRYAWVSLDGSSQIAVIDTSSNEVRARIGVGKGRHDFAFTSDGQTALVSNIDGTSVHLVPIGNWSKAATEILLKTRPDTIAYGRSAQRFYVGSSDNGSISVIDPIQQQVVPRLQLKPGINALEFDSLGRFALATNEKNKSVALIDSATNLLLTEAEVPLSPQQISFTGRHAYVHGAGADKVALFGLAELRKGRLSPIIIQAGTNSPDAAAAITATSDLLAATPEGNSVMIANARDKAIYYYVEGMMAPMGTLQTYDRVPKGLMILDRSLKETAPGVYTTVVQLNSGGRFDVPIYIDQPRVTHCFQITIKDLPQQTAAIGGATVKWQPEFAGQTLKSVGSHPLRFKLLDASTGKPISELTDVQVLVFEPPGVWQQRQWASPVGPGLYEVKPTFPHAGFFQVLASIESRGIAFKDLRPAQISVALSEQERAANRTVNREKSKKASLEASR